MGLNNLMLDDRYQVDSCHILLLLIYIKIGTLPLDTMRAYTKAFSISTKWGFENRSWNKVDNHNATYKLTRQSIPDLPSSLVQGARDCACEALKAVKCETFPERKPLSAMRYNQRVITVNLVHGIATIASTKGRIKATFFVPSNYRDYLSWSIKSSTGLHP